MANIDNIFKSIEEQSKALAERLFKEYTQQALSDVKDFTQKSKDDLQRWTQQLVRREISVEEFESLVQGELDLAEMRALKQTGLAQVQIDKFISGVLDIIVTAATAAIP
jgi:predicted YcjX-like family ATPase